mgnify:CR=1 FL=1
MSTNLYDPDAELERLYAAITGRPAFSYDPASDPVYNSYAQSYQRRGRLAMRSTMGQAAALTGGYGSSYAQSVGQQQYDSYLQSLGEALPELYGMAWQRYNAEGDALKTAWELASERSEVKRESEREAAEREAAAQKSAETARRKNYDRLYKLIYNSGYNPNETELSDSGMTGEQASALLAEYRRRNKIGTSNSYTYRSGTSSGTKKTKKQKRYTAPKSTRLASPGRNLDAMM